MIMVIAFGSDDAGSGSAAAQAILCVPMVALKMATKAKERQAITGDDTGRIIFLP
jgi:hypothetical protein